VAVMPHSVTIDVTKPSAYLPILARVPDDHLPLNPFMLLVGELFFVLNGFITPGDIAALICLEVDE
jgi:hypothetical protein